ncbi:MAG: hypothetical protein JWP15_1908, partial [Alphaproteobacteria bacterium]|nr:hypothetical protein [Alphaproteobacteria bacterium]
PEWVAGSGSPCAQAVEKRILTPVRNDENGAKAEP